MKLPFFTQSIAIDLGTANTVIIENGNVILNEPSIIAIYDDQNKDCIAALGHEAKLMDGKGIRTVRPLVDGVITDFNAAEMMLKGFIQQAIGKRGLLAPSLRMIIAIPKGSSEVEKRAVRESAMHVGCRELALIYEPMADALGIGLDVNASIGNMIVDIGGGTTEIAVISLGRISAWQSIRIAGNEITKDIQEYLRIQYNIIVGETTAEKIKIAIGSVMTHLPEEEAPEAFVLRGRNVITQHPIEVKVSYPEIANCIDKTICKIESAILEVLSQATPELYSDIVQNGIWLTGGGSLLRGIKQRFIDKFNIQFHLADEPLKTVAKGTAEALNYPYAPYLEK